MKITEYKFKSKINANKKALYMKKIYGYKPTVFRVKMPRTGKIFYSVIKPSGLTKII